VTIHWIGHISQLTWQLRNAVAGFVRLNIAHTGTNLANVLLGVLERLGIANDVSYVQF
jgi:hypothetical protein